MPGREDEKERERKRRDTAASEVGQSSGVVSGGRTWEAQAAAARPLQVGARYTIFGWFSLCLIAVFGLSGCPVLESVLVWRCFQSRIMRLGNNAENKKKTTKQTENPQKLRDPVRA
jgi:hypothetical protein